MIDVFSSILLLFSLFLLSNQWYITSLQFIYNKYNNIHSLYLSFTLLLLMIYSQMMIADIFTKLYYPNHFYILFLIVILSFSNYIYISYIQQFRGIKRFFEYLIKNILICTVVFTFLVNNIYINFYVIIALISFDFIIISLINKYFKLSKLLLSLIYVKQQIGNFYVIYRQLVPLLNIQYNYFIGQIIFTTYTILEFYYIYIQVKQNKLD